MTFLFYLAHDWLPCDYYEKQWISFDASWSCIRFNHLLLALIGVIGVDAAILTLAFGPLRRGEKWAWWPEALLLVAAQGGYFLAAAFIPTGIAPGLAVNLAYVLNSNSKLDQR